MSSEAVADSSGRFYVKLSMQTYQFSKSDLSELKRLSELALSDKVRAFLLKTAQDAEAFVPKPESVCTNEKPSLIIPTKVLKNYAWEQNNGSIKVYLTIPEAFGQEDVEAKVTATSLSLLVKAGSTHYEMTVKRLFASVTPEKFLLKVKGNDLVLTLTKQNSKHWEHLSAADKPKQTDDDLSKDDKAEPGDKMMKLMRKLYDEGDDEMKRTMNKAWTEAQEKRTAGQDPVDGGYNF